MGTDIAATLRERMASSGKKDVWVFEDAGLEEARVDGIRRALEDAQPRFAFTGVRWAKAKAVPSWAEFGQVGHCLSALLFALIGGFLGRYFYATRKPKSCAESASV